jgi:isoleucyl-tRNA synthetase
LYLDVLKDRLYTLPAKSQPRRSAQTAMFHIAQALVRWITPILSFTADEIFPLLPGSKGESVFAQTWYHFPELAQPSAEVLADQARLREALDALRGTVKKQLETCRAAGEIGSPLDAVVTVYADADWSARLEPLRDELRFWFIVSECLLAAAELAPDTALAVPGGGLWISVAASAAEKCARCWHHRPEVGTVAAHPLLCARCAGNLAGQPELRLYF